MHSSRMRTVRSSSRRGGGSTPGTPRIRSPRSRHPPSGPGIPLEQAPPHPRDQALPLPPVDRHKPVNMSPYLKLRLRAVTILS